MGGGGSRRGEVLTFGYLVFVWMMFHLPITSIHFDKILAGMSEGFIIIVCKSFHASCFVVRGFSSIIVLESFSIIVFFVTLFK